jgi:hypothetical protein
VYVGCETAALQALGSISASLFHTHKYTKVCTSLGKVMDSNHNQQIVCKTVFMVQRVEK